MSSNGQIKCPEPVEAQRVGTTLPNDARWLKMCDSVTDNSFEHCQVHVVVDAVLQGYVETKVLSQPGAIIVQLSRSWEKVASILVKRDSHDAVRMVERELDTIAMMDVDVDVQHARVVPVRTGSVLRVGSVGTATHLSISKMASTAS